MKLSLSFRYMRLSSSLSLLLLILTSCTSDLNDPTIPEVSTDKISITITTSLTDVTYGPATRASVSDGVSRLVLKVFDAEGNAVTLQEGDSQVEELKQTKGGTGFGTFTGIRLKPGIYKFVCVGHKCGAADTGHATIASPTSVTLPDPGVFTTYSLVKEVTIPSTGSTQQTVEMQLVNSYSQVNVVSKDNIPTGTSKVRLTINPDGTEIYTYTFNPTNHLTTSDIKTVETFDVTSKQGKTLDALLRFLLPATPQHFTLLVETLDAGNNVLTTRTYSQDQDGNDILYHLGRTTKINTYLFSSGTSTAVTLDDWGSDNTYNID